MRAWFQCLMYLACFLNLPLWGPCSKDIQPPLTTVSRPDNRQARVSSQCHPDSLYHPTSLILSFPFGIWGRRSFLALWRYRGKEKKGLYKASPREGASMLRCQESLLPSVHAWEPMSDHRGAWQAT